MNERIEQVRRNLERARDAYQLACEHAVRGLLSVIGDGSPNRDDPNRAQDLDDAAAVADEFGLQLVAREQPVGDGE